MRMSTLSATQAVCRASDFDGDALEDLPAHRHTVDAEKLEGGAEPRPDRDGGRETDLVEAAVDVEPEARPVDEFLAEAVDHRQRQIAMGDRAPETGSRGARARD